MLVPEVLRVCESASKRKNSVSERNRACWSGGWRLSFVRSTLGGDSVGFLWRCLGVMIVVGFYQ